ncbi:MAG: AfsR/SARP family transcriptional regulator [Coriobacteriales bacterium]|jgi:DNA-binding SARP family transcriptional activator
MGTKTQRPIDAPENRESRQLGACDDAEAAKCQDGAKIPKMRVKLFGGLNITVAGEVIPDAAWKKSKSKLFFAHVVTSYGRAVNREHIIECLWPDLDQKRAIDNVYVAWSQIRRTFEKAGVSSAYVSSNKCMYRINTDLVESDVYEFDVLTRKMLFNNLSDKSMAQHIARMEQIYAGELLSGMSCDPFLTRLRNRYRDTYIDMLAAASQRTLAHGDHASALWFARKALNMENRREDVYQTLMLAQEAAGQRIPAMETFFMCKSYLDEELGVPLSRKTIEIYERLLNDDE